MRYINCASTADEQNIMSFQFQGDVYYQTKREVPANSELFVYYGVAYARKLGLHRGSSSKVHPVVFSCSFCNVCFTTSIQRDRHQLRFCRQRRFNETSKKALTYEEPRPMEAPAAFELDARFNKPGSEGRKRFRCGECSFSADARTTIKRHAATHTGERIFSCSHCEYKSSRKFCLARHLLTHDSDKKYACTLCDYRTRREDHLPVHMRVHSGEKPFKCTECEHACSSSSHLTRHKRAKHANVRPYACRQCTYTCATSWDLTLHIAIHMGEKKLSCSKCSYKSNRTAHLKRHMSRKHKTDRLSL